MPFQTLCGVTLNTLIKVFIFTNFVAVFLVRFTMHYYITSWHHKCQINYIFTEKTKCVITIAKQKLRALPSFSYILCVLHFHLNDISSSHLPGMDNHLDALHRCLRILHMLCSIHADTMSMTTKSSLVFWRSLTLLHLHFSLPKACSTITHPWLILEL